MDQEQPDPLLFEQPGDPPGIGFNIPGRSPGHRSAMLARSATWPACNGPNTRTARRVLVVAQGWIAGAGPGLASFSRPSRRQRRALPIHPLRPWSDQPFLEGGTPGGGTSPARSAAGARRSRSAAIRSTRSPVLPTFKNATGQPEASVSAPETGVPLRPQAQHAGLAEGAQGH